MIISNCNIIGCIGYGHIGQILMRGIIDTKRIRPSQLVVYDINSKRVETLRKKYPKVKTASGNKELIKKSNIIFVCVKPMDVLKVLVDIRNNQQNNPHIIIVAAAISFSNIEKIYSGKLTRIIPSASSEIKEGVTLVCHNKNVTKNEGKAVEKMLKSISTIKLVKETDFASGTDITSCGPGIISAIFQEYVEAATRNSGFKKEEVTEMVLQTLFGTSSLLYINKASFKDIINMVATKGGITEVGVKKLKKDLPPVFDSMFLSTQKKQKDMRDMIQKQFDEYLKRKNI